MKGLETVQWPGLFDSAFELEVPNQLILAAKELNKKLHEDVQDVSFVNVAQGVECQSLFGIKNSEQRSNGKNLARGITSELLTGMMPRMRIICSWILDSLKCSKCIMICHPEMATAITVHSDAKISSPDIYAIALFEDSI